MGRYCLGKRKGNKTKLSTEGHSEMKPILHSVLRKFWTSKWEGAKASQAAFRSLAISLQDLGNEPWEDFNN